MAVAPRTEPLRPLRPPRKRRVNESLRTWRWGDRIAFVLCWAAGLALCAIAGGDRRLHGGQGPAVPQPRRC